MDGELKNIIYINRFGSDGDEYVYDLLFTNEIDLAWGDDWNVKPAGICGPIPPTPDSYNEKLRISTSIKLDLAQENGCFSMQDCMTRVIALAWENIDDYDVFEPDERLVIQYGETYDEIIEKINNKKIKIINNEKT